MKFLYTFLPVLLFFVSYKLWNIYAATVIAIITYAIQVFLFWFKHHKLEKIQMITLLILISLGTATLILHNPMFIKWKPTVIEWIFAIIFLGSQLVGKKPIIQSMMDNKINVPDFVWKRLNFSWGIFFLIMGTLNIYVIYHYSTNAWVNFKLFSMFGSTLLLVIIQTAYLSRYVFQKTED
jgi:intracellular septation protein